MMVKLHLFVIVIVIFICFCGVTFCFLFVLFFSYDGSVTQCLQKVQRGNNLIFVIAF